jgi:sterol desaturase/sphingolipid hydroxylase (fatty acid hydroxylase superfamily)
MPEGMIAWLRTMPLGLAAGLLFLENLVVFVAALLFGAILVRAFPRRRTAELPGTITRVELAAAASAVVLNTLVTLVGLLLWRAGVVRFRDDLGPWAIADVFVLLLAMDLAMYVLHRMAHHPWLFPLLHRLHHRFDRPRPLTLFVLNPVETVSFGGLWLVVIAIYPSSWLGMSIYLALNVAFGVLGHIGVEPFPRAWVKWPGLRHVGTSTFHAQHHADPEHNFGFYTLVWDRIFGTLSPEYEERFGL